jgi:hypothetical protein
LDKVIRGLIPGDVTQGLTADFALLHVTDNFSLLLRAQFLVQKQPQLVKIALHNYFLRLLCEFG